jgi:hypothetical protein
MLQLCLLVLLGLLLSKDLFKRRGRGLDGSRRGNCGRLPSIWLCRRTCGHGSAGSAAQAEEGLQLEAAAPAGLLLLLLLLLALPQLGLLSLYLGQRRAINYAAAPS